MRKLLQSILHAAVLAAAAAPLRAAGPAALPGISGEVTIYRGASVWNGKRMVAKTLIVDRGKFVAHAPKSARISELNLSGRYIVPAFGNAHEHITNANPGSNWAYLEEGVFYVWNPNSIEIGQASIDYFKRPDTIDVGFAMGGLTEPGGHPEPLYTDILSQRVYVGKKLDWFVGNAFHYGRTPKEIDASLDKLVEQQANFVKAYLLFSENYAERAASDRYRGLRGLNPANFKYLVAAAKRRGLPTYAHAETRFDLLTAARSGGAVAGHLPPYRSVTSAAELAMMQLSDADARAVADSRMMLVPTFGLAWESYGEAAKEPGFDPSERDRVFAVQSSNMRKLASAGATFLTGTDRNPAIFEEIEHWVAIGGMVPAEALKATLATGKRMFPNRRIGCFEPGCEADFLVLGADPTRDLKALRKIERIVKAGEPMTAPAGN